MDLETVLNYIQEYEYDQDGNITNHDGHPIEGELAENIKVAFFASHLAYQLYLEDYTSKKTNASYRPVRSEYVKKALTLLKLNDYKLENSKSNNDIMEAIIAGNGHVKINISSENTAMLKMFSDGSRPYYLAYLNQLFKARNLVAYNFELNYQKVPNSNDIQVSIDTYLASKTMDETERKLKANVMLVRHYMKNYYLNEEGRLVNKTKSYAFEDESLPNYMWAAGVLKDAEYIRERVVASGEKQEALDYYIEAVLYERLLRSQQPEEPRTAKKPKAQAPENTTSTIDQNIPNKKDNLAPTAGTNESTSGKAATNNQEYEAPGNVSPSDMPKSKTFMSFAEISNYVNNYYVKEGKVYSKNGEEITDQDLIDKVKTAIMFYCEARDLHDLMVNTYGGKEQSPIFYFGKVLEKYGANGEVNEYGINKLINALLNCNGHFEDQYIPLFNDKYAVLKGSKKDYLESYLRLKLKEKGISLESINVKFESVENSHFKVTVDMKLIPLKNKTKEEPIHHIIPQKTQLEGTYQSLSKSDDELTIEELKAKIKEAEASIAHLQALLQKLEEKEKTNSGPENSAEKTEQRSENTPENSSRTQNQSPHVRKVEKRRKCTIFEKVKNAALIAGAILFGENVTNRTPAYREINAEIGSLRYESAKGSIIVTSNDILRLKNKMASSKELTEKERKKLERKINRLSKKAIKVPVRQPEPTPQVQANSEAPTSETPTVAQPSNEQLTQSPASSSPSENSGTQPSADGNPIASPLTENTENPQSPVGVAEDLIKSNPLTVSDEEWKNMDLEQQKACAKIKIHEATLTNKPDVAAYWQGIYEGLELQSQFNETSTKGR